MHGRSASICLNVPIRQEPPAAFTDQDHSSRHYRPDSAAAALSRAAAASVTETGNGSSQR